MPGGGPGGCRVRGLTDAGPRSGHGPGPAGSECGKEKGRLRGAPSLEPFPGGLRATAGRCGPGRARTRRPGGPVKLAGLPGLDGRAGLPELDGGAGLLELDGPVDLLELDGGAGLLELGLELLGLFLLQALLDGLGGLVDHGLGLLEA